MLITYVELKTVKANLRLGSRWENNPLYNIDIVIFKVLTSKINKCLVLPFITKNAV